MTCPIDASVLAGVMRDQVGEDGLGPVRRGLVMICGPALVESSAAVLGSDGA